ncbi:MAG: PQQ-dependent sugar dehydrogenase [Acidobacteriota bacterium]
MMRDHRSALPGRMAGILAAMLCGVPAATAQTSPFDCSGVPETTGTAVQAATVITGVSDRPLYVTAPPGDRDRLFIVGQDGVIHLWKRGNAPTQLGVFLDISSRVLTTFNEQGLLGLAFAPDYDTSGEFFVNYTAGTFFNSFTVVARYRVSASDPDVADPTEERLLTIPQPEANHNGGQVFFGPDGYLYVATGDGGGGGDQHGTCGNGQDPGTLLGKLLRIDVRGVSGEPPGGDCGGIGAYAIPADNPFVGQAGSCDEIWSTGLRNPWRSAFDADNGDLYIADVGQDCWEEVDWSPAVSGTGAGAGVNWGWRQMEGMHCFDGNSASCDPPGVSCPGVADCNDPLLTLPVHEESHAAGSCSITGGYVYRGCRLPALRGRYFYGDFCAGYVRSFRISGGQAVDPVDWTEELLGPATTLASHTSFGEDAEGELYLVARDGDILKILPDTDRLEVSAPGAGTPLLLGEAGWTWEDLQRSTMLPIDHYRVYRGVPNGTFDCVHRSTLPEWTGDPDLPPAGERFAYLVTAVDTAGIETSPGEPAAARQLSAAACP